MGVYLRILTSFNANIFTVNKIQVLIVFTEKYQNRLKSVLLRLAK